MNAGRIILELCSPERVKEGLVDEGLRQEAHAEEDEVALNTLGGFVLDEKDGGGKDRHHRNGQPDAFGFHVERVALPVGLVIALLAAPVAIVLGTQVTRNLHERGNGIMIQA